MLPRASRPLLRSAPLQWLRPALALGLGLAEMLTTSLLFVFEQSIPAWQHPVRWVRQLVLLGLFATAAWAIIAWPQRQKLTDMWAASDTARNWQLPLAINLVLFAGLTAATIAFSDHVAPLTALPLGWFGLYCIMLVATGVSLLWLAAPARFWRTLITEQRVELAVAAAAGAIVLALGTLTQLGWESLSGITLELVARLLMLLGQEVHLDYSSNTIILGVLAVTIDSNCSGYEGMGLVTAFLALFLWVFRSTLRFPHAFLLLPIGLVAILVLNVLRIALLTALGAHVSPAVAANGFHSQAGWMAFLIVTVGIMALVPRLSFFAIDARRASVHQADHGDRIMLAYMVPFLALMAGSILASASAPYHHWLYGMKVVAAGVALWLFREHYRPLAARVDPLALAVGLAIGGAWIATDPGIAPGAVTAIDGVAAWIAAQPMWIVAGWLVVRATGSVLVVPVVEELAFRGVLYRWIVSRRFETVPFDRLSWIALVVSSALFGLLHSRPMAGALAGAVLALLMVRQGRLMDAIVAHVAANGLIIAWAIGARQWTLL